MLHTFPFYIQWNNFKCDLNTSEIWSNDRLNITHHLVATVHNRRSISGQNHLSCMSHQFLNKCYILVVESLWLHRTIWNEAYLMFWVLSVKVPWLLGLSGLSRFLRSSCVRQINLEDHPTSGLEIEMSKFLSCDCIGKSHCIDPNICDFRHDCWLPLCWQRYRRVLQKAFHVFGCKLN